MPWLPLNLQGDSGQPGAVAYANVVLADHGRTLDCAFANAPGADPAAVANSLSAELWKRSAGSRHAYARAPLRAGADRRRADPRVVL